MAQRIGAKGKPVGRPPVKAHARKAGKAPIDEFFDAVRTQRNPIKAVGVKAPKAPRPRKPAKVGPYTKGYKAPAPPKPAAPASPDKIQSGVTPRQYIKSGAAYKDKKGKLRFYPATPVADISAGTLSLGGLADRVSRLAVGPNITDVVEGKGTNSPLWAAAEGASIFPFFRVARGIGEGVRAARAGEDAARVARAAGKAAARGSRLPKDRVIRLTDRTGSYEARVPAAPEAHVRAAQKAADRNLERVVREGHKQGLTMHESLAQRHAAAKLAARHLHRLTERTGFYEGKGVEAEPKALAHLKLTDSQHVALQQLAKRVHPNITIKANLSRIEEARAAGDSLAVRDLQRHNELLRASRHYLEGDGASLRLRAGTDKASRKLAEGWQAMQRVGESSEASKIRMGELTPEIAAARKNAPGELDLSRSGYQGYATHEGNLYYPSAREGKKFTPTGQYKTRSWKIPFAPKGESKQPWTGALQERGQESVKAANLVGRQAVSRHSRELATERLTQLRKIGMRDNLPQVGELDKAYRAIPLVASPGSGASQRLMSLMAHLEQKTSWTVQEAESVGKTLEDFKNEIVIPPSQVLKEGQLPKEYALVHRAFLGAIDDPKLFRGTQISELHRTMMTLSSLSKDMVVYTKIGHMPPRLASNILMALPDTGLDFARAVRVLPGLYKQRPDLVRWIHELQGGGYFKSLTETTSLPHAAAQGVNKALVGWIERTADRDPRIAAFLAFAIKDSGHSDLTGLIKYLDGIHDAKPGTEEWYARTRVLQPSRQAAGEYERVGRDASLGNWIFLYRWIKASTVWTSRFVVKHPVQAAALGYGTSQYGYQAGNPIWNRFNIVGHNVQTALPWSTPPEITERGARAFMGGFPPLGTSPLDMLHPMIPAAAEAIGHVDIERGHAVKGNSWESALMNFLHQTPPGALLAGKAPAEDRVLKYLFGNYAPTTGSGDSGGTSPGPAVVTGGGRITPAQHARILHLMRQAQKNARRAAAQARRRQRRR